MPEETIRGLLAGIPLVALIVDPAERIIGANAEAQALLGRQIVGRHFATILRQPPVIDALERCLQRREATRTRLLSNAGGQDTTFDVSCRYIPDLGALLCFTDVTPMEKAGQMRRDFVANVSHELRTPLTALMGFIETLRGPARDDGVARERFLQIMEGEASRMNRLVGDLLSLNRVESQERVRPSEEVDLSALLKSTLNSIKPLSEEAGVVMNLTTPDNPVLIAGDPDQLRQVFTNLIENAIKYGGSGGVVDISLTSKERDPTLRAPSARILVADKGPGIDPIHLPRLTERFYRADSHRSRELGGTGLGLAIVKHIINRHRGRLRIESELGQGTKFTVILPQGNVTEI
ncbi:ATP-binding protein [Ruegeria sp. 2205SS24-7]|uniref:ATP-binding protein n=1 Tax=Ruegeria discodermiae TaxID=3064389 RepID=UPI0027426EB4|nr:ATP-binding protein [Ruegeria sp. 2205SS24-7]MDP5216209.1 ATP-binding protein [Ruegeria sp. 2205SS24-7]